MQFLRGPAWLAGILSCVVLALIGTQFATAAPLPALGSLAADAESKAATDRAVEAGRRERAALASPDAVAARKASTDEFSGLSAAGALETFTDTFEQAAEAPAYSTDGLIPDGKGEITKVIGDKQAQVALPGGRKAILVSGVPLQVPVDGGGKENVDAALTSDGGDLVPVAPLEDYSVSKDLEEGIDLEDADVTITPVGSGVDGARAQRVGDSVFWANTSRDTDFAVTPLADGVETFHQLRSQDAPESFPLDVTVPDGGTIVRSTQIPAALEIKDADGNIVSTVSPVVAQDADGTDVPASYAIDNDRSRITIEVPHRDRDVHYPILVDPLIRIYQLLDDNGASNGNYPGWVYVGNPGVSSLAGHAYLGWGNFTWLPANQAFNLNDGGYWYFPAPGDSAISSVVLRSTYYTQGRHSCIWEGITTYGGGWQNGMTALDNGTDLSPIPYIRCAAGYDAAFNDNTRGISNSDKGPGSAVLFAIVAWAPPGAGWVTASPDVDIAHLKASDVMIEDNKKPTITTSNTSTSVTFHVNDTGTGVKWAEVKKNGGWSQDYNFDCTHGEVFPMFGCNKNRDITVSGLNVGEPIQLGATDAVNNDGAIFWDTFYPTSWTYGGPDRTINTTPEIEAAAAALFSADDDGFQSLFEGLRPSDYNTLIAWRGANADWEYNGNGDDDSDIPEPPGNDGHTSSPRAHWGHWHVHRRWSDSKARAKVRLLRDSSASMGAVAIIFGLLEDPPGAILGGIYAWGFNWMANKISDAREDANGRGVTADLGFRCANIPYFPDPCWPAFWAKPIPG